MKALVFIITTAGITFAQALLSVHKLIIQK